MQFNSAINPKDVRDTIATTLMPCRSKRIKHVKPMPPILGVGGMSDLKTGTVYIPSVDSAFGRLTRYHEALHIQHTPKVCIPRDLLDQALEDARLHRFCSRASSSVYQVARRDELTTALRDFRAILQFHAMGTHEPHMAVMALRGLAILLSASMKPSHMSLCKRALVCFGPSAYIDMLSAINALAASDGVNTSDHWLKARAIVAKYFAESYTPPTSDATITPTDSDDTDAKPDTLDAPSTDEKVFDPAAKETDKAEDSKPTGYADASGAGDDSASAGDSDADIDSSSDTDSDTDTIADIEEPRDIPEAISTVKIPKPKRKGKRESEDLYTADLTPACDADNYSKMQRAYPQKLFIQRLDMGINRVKLSLGRKSPMPVTSGRRILSGKLASARTTPGMRVFSRPIASGGFGTILIDASGSMSIPEKTLKKFLSNAPALTLAFYNAPHDKVSHGNIFIYAANGYRADAPRIGDIPHYGTGNIIDYQALAWLIKQPAPHYYVGDLGFTGPWTTACTKFAEKLKNMKQITHVRNLQEMSDLLKQNSRKGH